MSLNFIQAPLEVVVSCELALLTSSFFIPTLVESVDSQKQQAADSTTPALSFLPITCNPSKVKRILLFVRIGLSFLLEVTATTRRRSHFKEWL